MRSLVIRSAEARDVPQVAAIYNHYVLATIVTFEEAAVPDAEMARRMDEVAARGLPWLVAERGDVMEGFAYASRWRERHAYRRSSEVTVYVAPGCEGRGVGSSLYAPLLSTLGDQGMHAALGGIALPNPASIALHEKFGFRKVAHLEQVGYKFNQWIDVGYWQRIL